MKKCISILLIILLSVNSGGFIIIYFQLLNSVRQEMLTSIRDGSINSGESIQFRISKAQYKVNIGGFNWHDSNEFEYKDCLYDIIKISETGNSLILFCINDKTEEKIVKSFNGELNNLAKGDLRNSKLKTSVINLVSQALIKNSFEPARNADTHKYISIHKEKILLNEKEIPSPPPRIA